LFRIVETAQYPWLHLSIVPTALLAHHWHPLPFGNEPMPVSAHPPHTSGWNPKHQRVIADIRSNNRTGGHERISTYLAATNDGRVRADRGSSPDERALVKVAPHNLRSRIRYVRKYARWSTENIVLQHHPCVQRNVVLNFDVISDHDVICDEDILAE